MKEKINDFIKKLDELLTNKVDRFVPNILGSKRVIKNEIGLLMTGIYCLGIVYSVYFYCIPQYDIFGNFIPKSAVQTAIVIIGDTILSYMIYWDMRFYMKQFNIEDYV